MNQIELRIELPERHRRLRVPASEFARVYNKPVQTIHNWAKTGVIKDIGCDVEIDPTRHLFICVPSTHEYHWIFLYRKSLAGHSLREWHRVREESLRDDRKLREHLQDLMATFFACATYEVTGWTGLGPFTLTEKQFEDIRCKAESCMNQFLFPVRRCDPALDLLETQSESSNALALLKTPS